MNAKLMRALLCVVIAGAFWAPVASAGVFQLVEVTSGNLDNRHGAGGEDDGEDDGSDDGDRSIESSQPSPEPSVLEMLLNLLRVDD